MKPLMSEFSYGYALTEELSTGVLGGLHAAPVFPSLYDEGQPGGGWDLKLPLHGSPLYLQFKLAHYMKMTTSAEWDIWNSPYYRMHLRPLRHSSQHQLLQDLQALGEEVYYVAPIFHKTDELNVHYLYSGPGFLGHEIVLNLESKEKEHGKGWKPLWCNGGRA